MKAFLAFSLSLAFSLIGAVAQTAPTAKPAAVAATNQPASTNKTELKEMMQGPVFTNNTGMAMVKISPALWAGMFEVTQDEYQKVMGGNPSEFKGARNPVDSVSWNDARTFCAKLTEVEKKADLLPEGFEYTLPTQAQWESLMDAADLKDAITAEKSSRSGTSAVGTLNPNSLGLYDTRGNVLELCLDPDDKPYRVLRGAAWDTSVEVNLRPEFRWYSNGPDDKKNTYGFRAILAPPAGK